ncbi:MAG: hypothetical protein ABIF82_11605 [Planctomycetota bacterium]
MSSGAHVPGVEEKIDVRKYILVLKRRKWWGIVPFVVLAAAFTIICLAVPPKYLSTCVIKASKDEVRTILEGGLGEPITSSTIVQAEMLRPLAVMTALADTDLMAEIEAAAQKNPEIRAKLEDRLYRRIEKNTTLQELGKILMRISHLGDNPAQAKTVLEKLVNHFVENALSRERTTARRAREMALTEQTRASDQLESLDGKLVTFRQDHPGVPYGDEGGKRDLLEAVTANLAQLDSQIEATRRKLARYAQQLENMPQQVVDEVKTMQNPEVIVYRRRLADLRTDLAMALKTFTPLHPAVKSLQQQVQATQQELARAQREAEEDEVSLRRNAVHDQLEEKKLELQAALDYLLEARRHQNLRKTELQEEVRAIPGLQKELTSLMRDRTAASERLGAAREKFARAEEEFKNRMEGLVSFSILRPAREPQSKDVRHIIKLAMLGAFVCFAAAFGAIAGTEFLDQSFSDVESVRSFLSLPSLGVIPYIETPRARRGRLVKLAFIAGSIVVGVAVIAAAMLLTNAGVVVWEQIKDLCKGLA